jgi:tetratricopeptide (TPR) repeat protein
MPAQRGSFWKKYRTWTLPSRIGVWGAVASIIGIPLAFCLWYFPSPKAPPETTMTVKADIAGQNQNLTAQLESAEKTLRNVQLPQISQSADIIQNKEVADALSESCDPSRLLQNLLARRERAQGESRTAINEQIVEVALDSNDLPTAKEAVERLLASNPTNLNALNWSASVLSREGKPNLAIEAYQRGITEAKKQADDRAKAILETNLASEYCRQGRTKEAEPLLRNAVDVLQRISDLSALAVAYANLGDVAGACGDFGAQESYYLRSLELGERAGRPKTIIIKSLLALANLHTLRKNPIKAEELLKRSLSLSERAGKQQLIVASLCRLAGIYLARKDNAKASEYYHKAVKLADGALIGLLWVKLDSFVKTPCSE